MSLLFAQLCLSWLACLGKIHGYYFYNLMLVFTTQSCLVVVCFSSEGVAAHTAHSRFRPITEAYSWGCPTPFLPEVSSVWQSRDSNPRPCGWIVSLALSYIFGRASPHSSRRISDRPTAIVSKVGADAPVECKSSYKHQQPQPSSTISLPLTRDYSPCKGGQLLLM